MPEKFFLRFFYYITSTPLKITGNLFLFIKIADFKQNLEKCLKIVEQKKSEIPESYISYLIKAEDHRSAHHYGIDPIGVARAFCVLIRRNKLQGASTIEQQFVRVVTENYSRTLKRKLTEQILAIQLTKRTKKSEIARSYLAIAYYGYDCEGTKGILSLTHNNIENASEEEKISIIARLKYPKPKLASKSWSHKIIRRVSHIKNLTYKEEKTHSG